MLLYAGHQQQRTHKCQNANPIKAIGHRVRCRCNTVHCISSPHNRQPITRSWDDGYLLGVQTLLYSMPQTVQCCMEYNALLDRTITQSDCIWHNFSEILKTNIDFLAHKYQIRVSLVISKSILCSSFFDITVLHSVSCYFRSCFTRRNYNGDILKKIMSSMIS